MTNLSNHCHVGSSHIWGSSFPFQVVPNNVKLISLSLTTWEDEKREALNHEESIKSTKEARIYALRRSVNIHTVTSHLSLNSSSTDSITNLPSDVEKSPWPWGDCMMYALLSLHLGLFLSKVSLSTFREIFFTRLQKQLQEFCFFAAWANSKITIPSIATASWESEL